MNKKTRKYIHSEKNHNLESARKVFPYLLQDITPQSVIDLGCGLGEWLKTIEEMGVKDIHGVNGHWVEIDKLYIDASNLEIYDLEKVYLPPRRFALAICLEVAEHLHKKSAKNIVQSLVNCSDTILFSAAIPNQDGQNHLNEQWPSYWQKLFERHGYYFKDSIRPKIWHNQDIHWWYRQNMFLISNKFPPPTTPILQLIHPELYEYKNWKISLYKTGKIGVKESFFQLLRAILFFVKKK